jgi:hypothetical protein
MPLKVDHRIVHIGMLIVALGKEDVGPNIYGLAPKFRKKLALDLNELDPGCVPGVPLLKDFPGLKGLDWWNDLGEEETDGFRLRWIQIKVLHLAMGIPRGDPRVLTFPSILVKGDHVAIGPVEDCVDVEEGLNVVLPWWDLREGRKGIAPHRGIAISNDHGIARPKVFHILAPEGNTGDVNLLPRFA